MNETENNEFLGYSEEVIRFWFLENFDRLGYSQIVGGSREGWQRSVPDFVMLKNNKEVKVELETVSSHFFLHKHTTNQVDEVVCFFKDKELPINVIEIKDLIIPEELELHNNKVIFQSEKNQILLYEEDWLTVKEIVGNIPNLYEQLEELSESNPEKFSEVYRELHRIRMERTRKDYEEHNPFSPEAKSDSKYCSNCGVSLNQDAKFCYKCGRKQ